MYVRLAFAVAAHLEPEILIVDEVLAVGDAEFQKKCLGKMGEVARSGRTVLFVSHQLATVEHLCQTGLLLDKGVVRFHGPVREAIAAYSSTVKSQITETFAERTDRRGSGLLRFVEARVLDRHGKAAPALTCGDTFIFELRLRNTTRRRSGTCTSPWAWKAPSGSGWPRGQRPMPAAIFPPRRPASSACGYTCPGPH